MPEIAGKVHVDGEGHVTIDGQPFPFYLAADEDTIAVQTDGATGISRVRLTVLADSVEIEGRNA